MMTFAGNDKLAFANGWGLRAVPARFAFLFSRFGWVGTIGRNEG